MVTLNNKVTDETLATLETGNKSLHSPSDTNCSEKGTETESSHKDDSRHLIVVKGGDPSEIKEHPQVHFEKYTLENDSDTEETHIQSSLGINKKSNNNDRTNNIQETIMNAIDLPKKHKKESTRSSLRSEIIKREIDRLSRDGLFFIEGCVVKRRDSLHDSTVSNFDFSSDVNNEFINNKIKSYRRSSVVTNADGAHSRRGSCYDSIISNYGSEDINENVTTNDEKSKYPLQIKSTTNEWDNVQTSSDSRSSPDKQIPMPTTSLEEKNSLYDYISAAAVSSLEETNSLYDYIRLHSLTIEK